MLVCDMVWILPHRFLFHFFFLLFNRCSCLESLYTLWSYRLGGHKLLVKSLRRLFGVRIPLSCTLLWFQWEVNKSICHMLLFQWFLSQPHGDKSPGAKTLCTHILKFTIKLGLPIFCFRANSSKFKGWLNFT